MKEQMSKNNVNKYYRTSIYLTNITMVFTFIELVYNYHFWGFIMSVIGIGSFFITGFVPLFILFFILGLAASLYNGNIGFCVIIGIMHLINIICLIRSKNKNELKQPIS